MSEPNFSAPAWPAPSSAKRSRGWQIAGLIGALCLGLMLGLMLGGATHVMAVLLFAVGAALMVAVCVVADQ